MKTEHRELIKMACRILSAVYYSTEFDDPDKIQELAKIRTSLVTLIYAKPKELTEMLGHDVYSE